MKSLIASALMLFAPALVLAQAPAPKTEAKPAAQAANKPAANKSSDKAAAAKTAKNTKPTKKVETAKADPASSRTQLRSATGQVAAGIMAAEAALSPEELAIAERVHVGRIPCELGAYVTLTAEPARPGHFHVEGKGFKYFMAPVATTTGTVRLEDQKGGAVWLQIANKSMLMNQKLGQRLADECMSPQQTVVAEAIKKNPPVSVLEPLK
jgi:carbon monoxide dehydrogenase subunit G